MRINNFGVIMETYIPIRNTIWKQQNHKSKMRLFDDINSKDNKKTLSPAPLLLIPLCNAYVTNILTSIKSYSFIYFNTTLSTIKINSLYN